MAQGLNLVHRRVEPEWLDTMPADDSRAARSRRDLRRINRLMGQARIVTRVLEQRVPSHRPRIADLGAGDGTLLVRVLSSAVRWRAAEVALVDRQTSVSAATMGRYEQLASRAVVFRQDVFEWLRRTDDHDVIVANLFLHHFQTADLAELFQLVSRRTRLFVACEPRRARFALVASHLLGAIGCNDVTRHDAVLSVRAGFAEKQLSALWPARANWQLEERRAGLFSHLFVAERTQCRRTTQSS